MVVVGVAAAAQTADQDKRITIDVKDADVRFVVAAIFDQAGLDYSIGGDVQGTVTARIENRPVKDTLRAVLSPLGCTWRISSGTYVICKKQEPKPREEPPPVYYPPEGGDETPGDKVVRDKVVLDYQDAADIVALLQGGTQGSPRGYGLVGNLGTQGGQWNPFGSGYQSYGFSGPYGYGQGNLGYGAYPGIRGYGIGGQQYPTGPGNYGPGTWQGQGAGQYPPGRW